MRMARLAIATTVTLMLVGTVASGAVAQSPSPDPPPWFGGRVEMPEHGFAVTLPDNWVAFDLGADIASQVEAASDNLASAVWGVDGLGLVDQIAAMNTPGMHLLSIHTARYDHCLWAAVPASVLPSYDLAEKAYEGYADDPSARDVEPPRRVELPIGPAYHLRMSVLNEMDFVWASSSTYLIDKEEGMLVAVCLTYDARPEDYWLSIVETVESLPAE